MNTKKKVPHRIPYETWAHSQLSVAKFYGGAVVNGKKYVLDFENCKTKIVDGEVKYFPDLVEVIDDKNATQ